MKSRCVVSPDGSGTSFEKGLPVFEDRFSFGINLSRRDRADFPHDSVEGTMNDRRITLRKIVRTKQVKWLVA
ncbi:hypothetical protein N8571_01570 [Akkermansiaceae bacterium]|nr:hypothetical protein [Akkermansiaceae bacterium]